MSLGECVCVVSQCLCHYNYKENLPPTFVIGVILKLLLGLEFLFILEEGGDLELVSEGQKGGQPTHVILHLK